METVGAVLLLGLSAVAAWRGGAVELLLGYWISLVIPVGYYGWRLRGYVRGLEGAGGAAAGAGGDNLKVELRTGGGGGGGGQPKG